MAWRRVFDQLRAQSGNYLLQNTTLAAFTAHLHAKVEYRFEVLDYLRQRQLFRQYKMTFWSASTSAFNMASAIAIVGDLDFMYAFPFCILPTLVCAGKTIQYIIPDKELDGAVADLEGYQSQEECLPGDNPHFSGTCKCKVV